MNNYFDRLGRVHTKPIKPNDEFPTNNAWIYTGIYETLREVNLGYRGVVPPYDSIIETCRLRPHVYSRHPYPYRWSINMTPISHDEIIGICMLSTYHALIVNTVKPYFCDIPKYEIKPKSTLFQRVKSWGSYLYRVIVKKENQRRITKEYPALFGTFFTHRRQYRYIYESLSLEGGTFLNRMSWVLARLLDVATNSISLMHYMAVIRMEQVENEDFLFKLVANLMDRSIIRKYGSRPIEKMLEEYLLNGTGTVDKQHPWLIEIREFYNKRG